MKNNILVSIAKLKHFNMSFITIERILGLPFGVINEWESGETKAKAEDKVLLSIITTFPWMLNVAEDDYDLEKTKVHLLKVVQKTLTKTRRKQMSIDIEKIKQHGAKIAVIDVLQNQITYAQERCVCIRRDVDENFPEEIKKIREALNVAERIYAELQNMKANEKE